MGCFVGLFGGFPPMEGQDLRHDLIFWGKSLQNLQGVFMSSMTYLEIFVSTCKRILPRRSTARSLHMASARSVPKKPVDILKKLIQ